MPELDLDELERLAKAATPGPWYPAKNHTAYEGYGDSVFTTEQTHNLDNNLAYIVAACNAVPELIDMYREADDEAYEADKAWKNLRKDYVTLLECVRELEKKLSQVTYRHDKMAKLYSEYHDANSTLKERLAELEQENSRQKRVIHILENRVLELKGKPIPMEPRLPTCDAL